MSIMTYFLQEGTLIRPPLCVDKTSNSKAMQERHTQTSTIGGLLCVCDYIIQG